MNKKFKILLVYPNPPLMGPAPSNLALLSACLKQDGFDVKLFDCTLYKLQNEETNDDVREKLGHVKKSNLEKFFLVKNVDIYEDFVHIIEEYKPNLIAVSIVDMTLAFSLSLLEKIKDKNIPVIAGGVGPTFEYKKILDTGLVNFVCIGEGEKALVELCNKLYNNEDCSNIQNIYLKDKNGNIIKNLIRPLVNISKLPIPDFSIYEPYRFYRPFFGTIIRMMCIDTDRGCPGNCSYCAAPSLRRFAKQNNCGKIYRIKDFDKVFQETKELIKKHDINFIFLSSESFLSMPLIKIKEFSKRYKKEINLPFYTQSRLDTFTEEKTRLLAEMGCKSIGIGLEHGSEEIRYNLLNKRISNEKIINAFMELSKYDIIPGIHNMIGLPDETRENIFETIELNRQVSQILKGRHTLNIFTFMPFSGSDLREMCIKKGYITGKEDIPYSWFKYSLLTMPSISIEEIYGLEKTFVLYVLLPKSYWSDIKIAEQNNKEGEEMFNKLMEIKNEKYLKI